MNAEARVGAVDGKAVASFLLAVLSVLTAQSWLVATVAATAAISLALASRRTLREAPHLRGTVLSLSGFLIAVGVLLIATVGPSLLTLFLFSLAPVPAT